MATNNDIEKQLWAAADQLWANSNLKPSEFSTPVLGLIFLRYADYKFTQVEAVLANRARASQGRRKLDKTDYQAEGVLYLPESARFSNLQKIPEGENLGRPVSAAIKGWARMPISQPSVRGGRTAAQFCLAWHAKGFSDSPESVPSNLDARNVLR